MQNFTRILRVFTFSALLVAAVTVDAQNTHEVETQGFEFVPSQITVTVGDTVRWFNTGGTHSINGSLTAYPENPEPFGIGVGSGWVYAHKFTIPGIYNYHCDPHVSLGMEGVVIVEDISTGLDELISGLVQHVFPIPADDHVILQLDEAIVQAYPDMRIKLYDQTGREHMTQAVVAGSRQELDVRELPGGLYIFQLIEGDAVLHTGKVVIQ